MAKIHMNDWPPHAPSDVARREGTIVAARLMANAAQTAPKAGGIDQIECCIVYGQEELERIARKVEELSSVNPNSKVVTNMFRTEAVMVRESDCVLFIGNYRAHETFDFGCGYCGGQELCGYVLNKRPGKYGVVDLVEDREERKDMLVGGPLCSFAVQDLGIAVGSATFIAKQLFVDTRPMMSVGAAGQKLGYCPDSQIVVALPMASLPKNPYNDVMPEYHLLNRDKVLNHFRKSYVTARMVNWFNYKEWFPKSTAKEDK